MIVLPVTRSVGLKAATVAGSGSPGSEKRGRVEAEGLPLSFLDLGGELPGISLTAESGLESAQFAVECLHCRYRGALTDERG